MMSGAAAAIANNQTAVSSNPWWGGQGPSGAYNTLNPMGAQGGASPQGWGAGPQMNPYINMSQIMQNPAQSPYLTGIWRPTSNDGANYNLAPQQSLYQPMWSAQPPQQQQQQGIFRGAVVPQAGYAVIGGQGGSTPTAGQQTPFNGLMLS